MTGAAPEEKRSGDALLEALVYITSHFGHTRSGPALQAGLPVGKGGLTPRLFCQAADRAGFKARIVKRALDKVPPEVAPAVIVTKDNKALVLLNAEKGICHIFDPLAAEARTASLKELAANYSGYCIYIKPDDVEEGAEEHWFWSNILDNRDIYVKVCVSALLINIFALTSPIFTMNFYDRVLPNSAVETGWVLAIGAGSIYIFDLIIRTLRAYFIDVAGRRSDVILAQRLFNQVLDMRLGVRTGATGSFANNLREFDSLREFFNSATATGLVDFPFSLLFVGAIWMIGGAELACLLIFLYGAVTAAGYLTQLPVRRKVHQAMKTGEQKHGLLVETIACLETIKGVGGEGHVRAQYAHYTGRSAEAGQASRFYSGLSVNFSSFVQQLSGIVIMVAGMYAVEAREISVGALMACIILSSRAIAPVGALAALVNRYHQAKSAYRNLDGIMRQPVERPRGKAFLHRPRLKGAFRLQNVSFAYPRTERPVLQGINLSVNAGEKLAISGRIGSGKSTLVKLLVDFYVPTEGTVLADDTDMRQLDPADLRRNIAYMGQDTLLMSGTVRENIVMGNPRATDEEVLRAATAAGVDAFIRRHPLGYDAPVGERGEGLSGGQRQAVALARTLLMDTPVVILDEPTNAMDIGTEEAVLHNLGQLLKDKTIIIVTHKPALLKLVNRLIIMDGGRTVIDGPRDAVLQALTEGKVAVPKD